MTPSQAKTIVEYFTNSGPSIGFDNILDTDLTSKMNSEIIFIDKESIDHFRKNGIKLGSIINEGTLYICDEDWTDESKGRQTIIERSPEFKLHEITNFQDDGSTIRVCQVEDLNPGCTTAQLEEALSDHSGNLNLRLDLGAVQRKAQTYKAGGVRRCP